MLTKENAKSEAVRMFEPATLLWGVNDQLDIVIVQLMPNHMKMQFILVGMLECGILTEEKLNAMNAVAKAAEHSEILTRNE
jgi:hypothetical protein